MLLISFSFVFILFSVISYQRFSPLYINENIKSVKSSIQMNASDIASGKPLSETSLMQLSSETSFIRYQYNQIVESIGPNAMNDTEVLLFVIDIFDSSESIKEDQLTYYVGLNQDIYEISYIYQFDLGDYLIVSTKIQSLQNIDRVLMNTTLSEALFMFVAILVLSIVISFNVSRPIKKISLYAKRVSSLDFSNPLRMKRKDEFRDLVSSLNEMTFNLKKTYLELNEANQKLSHDLAYDKVQEQKKKTLIMTINHEIKTPLAVMQGMIEGMIDGVGRYKDKETYLKALLKEIDTIKHITQDLTYSLRLEDKLVKDASVDTSTIETIIEPLMELAKQSNIRIIRKIEPKTVLMTEELFHMLVTNIVKNAITYTTSKSVTVLAYEEKNTYKIEVRNAGEIPVDLLDKVFEPFYRLNNDQSKKTGTGLGLSIVKQISSLYGYPYKLYNDNGEVVFKITIAIKF